MVFKKFKKESGFSIIEMLISIAIISLIMAVVVLNQGDFTDQFSLTTSANDLELQIRQAQVFGVSVREFSPSSNEFDSGYGVSLSTISTDYEKVYIAFADRGTKNGAYDGDINCTVGGSSECIKKVTFSRGVKINQVCALKLNNQEDCAPIVGRADITFNRPDPAALIETFDSQGNQNAISGVIGVRIELMSPKGKLKSIYVYTNGQISIS
ncbi:MAG: prepilin-type N-terminal cleavage/methylation domain-containing protein [Minisyncoccia bacterium]